MFRGEGRGSVYVCVMAVRGGRVWVVVWGAMDRVWLGVGRARAWGANGAS